MADSKIALITQNLVSALHGKKLARDSVRTVTCEEQRLQLYRISYPYLAIVGPAVQVTQRSAGHAHCTLNYSLYLMDNTLNDEKQHNKDPIAKQMQNDAADICKMVMTDITRGGYAVQTKWNAYDPMINPEGPEFILMIDIEVECFVNDYDPYLGG
jgi:hypothetical protein